MTNQDQLAEPPRKSQEETGEEQEITFLPPDFEWTLRLPLPQPAELLHNGGQYHEDSILEVLRQETGAAQPD